MALLTLDSAASTAAPALTLRPYQTEALEATLQAHSRGGGHPAALVVLPTGTGKTVLFSELVRRLDVPSLILAHREELLVQARDKLETLWPAADVGIVGAGHDEPGHRITIASIQSATRPRRLKWLATAGIQLVIVDEAHHTPAASYLHVLEALHAGRPESGVFLVGVTATPQRADAQSLADIFGPPVYVATLPQMVTDGWLSDLRGVQVRTRISLDGVHRRGGDFAEGELAQRVDVPERNTRIVEAWQARAARRPTIVFASSVQHAQHLAEAFAAAGITAAAVSGDTPREERRRILADYAAGRVQVLANCNVFTEGFDAPQTSCIVLARPTNSQSLYIQMAGRGARPAPGKTDCLILDIADVSTRHRLVQLPDLAGRGYPPSRPAALASSHRRTSGDTEDQAGRGTRADPPEGFSLRAAVTGPTTLHDVKLLRVYAWQHEASGAYWLELDDHPDTKRRTVLSLEPAQTTGTYWVYRLSPMRQRLAPQALPLGWAQSVAEQAAEQLQQGRAHLVDRSAPWRRGPASEKQRQLLAKLGIPHTATITKGDASDLLGLAFARSKQRGA